MNEYDRRLLASIRAAAVLTDDQALAIHRGVRAALRELDTEFGPQPGQLWQSANGMIWASVRTCDGTQLAPVDTSGDIDWTDSQVERAHGPLRHLAPHGDDEIGDLL